jgi:hypothetical protein
MKFWSAVILLLLQAQPLWGLVLCMGLGAADDGRMEAGCAMADHAAASPGAVEIGQPTLSDATSRPYAGGHGCMLADICTLVTPTLALRPGLLVIPNTPHDSAVWLSDRLHDQDDRAPPTPPPNS